MIFIVVKIKDGVDLKEFEKYGFVHKNDLYYLPGSSWCIIEAKIDTKNRIISSFGYLSDKFQDLCFKLYGLGLIEFMDLDEQADLYDYI